MKKKEVIEDKVKVPVVVTPLDVVNLAERVTASNAALAEVYKTTRLAINDLFLW